jgi:glycosyltransferase involved in cell wall biosynthesis
MPNAVLEALAMGLPVVSSGAGGLQDILRDGENGFIVPLLKDAPSRKKFDPLAVADAIDRLAQNPELYQRVILVNWWYARQRFAAPAVAKRLEEIYSSLLTPQPAGSGKRSQPVSPACVE